MDRKEEDRIFGEITRGKKLLQRLEADPRGVDPTVIEQLRRDLIATQNDFAAETTGTWVAIICRDYESAWGTAEKKLLPVSRFRDIRSSFESYNFGKMTFSPWKGGPKLRGVAVEGEHTNDWPNPCDSQPFRKLLKFGQIFGAENLDLAAFTTRKEAEGWLTSREGKFVEDILTEDLRRVRAKIAEQNS